MASEPNEPPANDAQDAPAPTRQAWPLGELPAGTPRWLAAIVLVALLGAAAASTWLILTLPPPGERESSAPAASDARP